MDSLFRLVIATTPAIQPGGLIDARKGYPTCDDSSEGREAAERHLALSDEPMTIHRCRRDGAWWVLAPLLSTLPGDIEGLRRDSTPMRHAHYGRGVAFSDLRGQPIILTSDGRCLTLNDGWSIDLSDETARAHVAAWLMRQEQAHLLMRDDASGEARHVFVQARDFESLTEREIDLLARLVLRLAGRS